MIIKENKHLLQSSVICLKISIMIRMQRILTNVLNMDKDIYFYTTLLLYTKFVHLLNLHLKLLFKQI